MSRWNMIVWVSLVLNRTVVDNWQQQNDWTKDNLSNNQ